MIATVGDNQMEENGDERRGIKENKEEKKGVYELSKSTRGMSDSMNQGMEIINKNGVVSTLLAIPTDTDR